MGGKLPLGIAAPLVLLLAAGMVYFGVQVLRHRIDLREVDPDVGPVRTVYVGAIFVLGGIAFTTATLLYLCDWAFGTETIDAISGNSLAQRAYAALEWRNLIAGVFGLISMVGIFAAVTWLLGTEHPSALLGWLVAMAALIALSHLLGRWLLGRNDLPFDPLVDLWRAVVG